MEVRYHSLFYVINSPLLRPCAITHAEFVIACFLVSARVHSGNAFASTAAVDLTTGPGGSSLSSNPCAMERSFLLPTDAVLRHFQVTEGSGLSATKVKELRRKYGSNCKSVRRRCERTMSLQFCLQHSLKIRRPQYGNLYWSNLKIN